MPLHREVRVREFDLGFVAWAEDREGGPSTDGGRARMVIARDSGETTLWPGLPVGEVIRRYEEVYGAPADGGYGASEAPAQRIDLEATSFLLTPPEWLQEAADGIGGADRRGAGSAGAAGAAGECSAGCVCAGCRAVGLGRLGRGERQRHRGRGHRARCGGGPGCRAVPVPGADAVGRDGHDRRCGRRGPVGGAARDGLRAAAGRFRRGGRRSADAAGPAGGQDRTAARRQSVAAYTGRARAGSAGGGRARRWSGRSGTPGRRARRRSAAAPDASRAARCAACRAAGRGAAGSAAAVRAAGRRCAASAGCRCARRGRARRTRPRYAARPARGRWGACRRDDAGGRFVAARERRRGTAPASRRARSPRCGPFRCGAGSRAGRPGPGRDGQGRGAPARRARGVRHRCARCAGRWLCADADGFAAGRGGSGSQRGRRAGRDG